MPRKPRRPREDNSNVPKNAPVLALSVTALLFVGAAVLVLTGNGGDTGGEGLVALAIANIPGVLAAVFAERTARDVRNGTVTEKARQGTHKALAEAGVVTENGPVVLSALASADARTAALTALLERTIVPAVEHNTDVTEGIADELGVEHNERTRNAPQQP